MIVFSIWTCKKAIDLSSSNEALISTFNVYKEGFISGDLDKVKPYLYSDFFEKGIDETLDRMSKMQEVNESQVLNMELIRDTTLILKGDTIIDLIIIRTKTRFGLKQYEQPELNKVLKDHTMYLDEKSYEIDKDSSYIITTMNSPLVAFSLNGGKEWYIEPTPAQHEMAVLVDSQKALMERITAGYDIIWSQYNYVPDKK